MKLLLKEGENTCKLLAKQIYVQLPVHEKLLLQVYQHMLCYNQYYFFFF